MPDARDANGAGVWTSGDVARRLGAELVGPGDIALSRLSTLEGADERSLAFIREARHAGAWAKSAARAALVSRGVMPVENADGARALIVVEDADHALIELLEQIAPGRSLPEEGVDASATVHPSATVAPGARVGPGARIGPGCVLGPGAALGPNAVLGVGVRVGAGCDIRACVVVDDRCTLGDRVVVHAGSVIGADGFGYRPAPDGSGLVKIPHAGAVTIGDDVEIGAATTIDRGKFGDTVIGAGTKIDNQVQIGHNCCVGRSCIICGAVALAGSVRLGDGVTLGGGVAVKDGIHIGDGASVGGRSGLMDDIPPGEEWVGYPARPVRETMRIIAAQSKLPEVVSKLKRLDQLSQPEGASA